MRGGRAARGLRQEASWVQWGLGVEAGERGLVHAPEPSALRFRRQQVLPARRNERGALRQPHFPSYPTVVPCSLRPRALADPPHPAHSTAPGKGTLAGSQGSGEAGV